MTKMKKSKVAPKSSKPGKGMPKKSAPKPAVPAGSNY